MGSPASISHGVWTGTETIKKSTWRELTAVSLLQTFYGKIVKWLSDNQAVVRIIKREYASTCTENCFRNVEIMMKNAISLQMQWIPRDQIDRTDYIGSIVDVDDWGICEDPFRAINCDWRPHEVDWFTP